MNDERDEQPLAILPFAWGHWRVRHHQLAEEGIVVPPEAIPDEPMNVGRDDHEWDYHPIADVFLRGAGGFWLAWWERIPVGHIFIPGKDEIRMRFDLS